MAHHSHATYLLVLQAFSFLAIATSFIGFVLGLTDFFQDALQLANKQRVVSYGLTVVPPYIFALAFPDIFFQALDLVRSRFCAATKQWCTAHRIVEPVEFTNAFDVTQVDKLSGRMFCNANE